MNDLRSVLVKTLNNYPKFNTKEKSYGTPNDNKVRKLGIPLVKSDFKKNKFNIFGKKILKHLDVNCSYGLGNHWASIPWITIFNPDQYNGRPSATKGIYLVYLFSNNLHHVYLSLNMGATKYAKIYQKQHGLSRPAVNDTVLSEIKNDSKDYAKELSNYYNKNNSMHNLRSKISSPIHLNDDSHDIKGHKPKTYREYENGNIASIGYSLESLKKINNSDVLSDLKQMIIIYNDLMYKIIPNDAFIKHRYDNTHKSSTSSTYHLSGIPTFNKGHLSKSAGKRKDHYNKMMKRNRNSNKKYTVNHSRKSNDLMCVGDEGEKFVVSCELRKLKAHAPELATVNNVHQVSATSKRSGNNALGYDVISRNIDGSLLHIEVKTTPVDDRNKPFDISDNEVQFAKGFINNPNKNHQSKNYLLYFLYNAKNKNTVHIRYFTPEEIVQAAKSPEHHQVKSYVFFM